MNIDSSQISNLKFEDLIDKILSLYARTDEIRALPENEKSDITTLLEFCEKEKLFNELCQQSEINKAILDRLLQLKSTYENNIPPKR